MAREWDQDGMLDAVGYEVEMLVHTTSLLGYLGSGGALTWAVLESQLLHVRNLVEFFYLNPDGPRAGNFVDAWPEVRPDGAELLSEEPGPLFGDLSDKLAHIGRHRSDVRGWVPGRLSAGLIETAAVWVANLPPAARETLIQHRPTLRGLEARR